MKPKLLTTLQDYSTKLLIADVVAAVTVAMVALPLSIAIAVGTALGLVLRFRRRAELRPRGG